MAELLYKAATPEGAAAEGASSNGATDGGAAQAPPDDAIDAEFKESQ